MAPWSSLWSQLDVDLLLTIFGLLKPDFCAILRYASVCNQWKQAAATFLLTTKTNTQPLLLLKPQHDHHVQEEPYPYRLFDIGTLKIITLPLPELQGTWFSNCSFGWLLTVGRQSPHEIHLLNPITRARIRLPQIPKSIEELRGLRVILSSRNPRDRNCSVLAAYPYDDSLGLWRNGNSTWTTMFVLFNIPHRLKNEISYVDDAIFFKGEFYLVGRDDFMYKINSSHPRPVLKRLKRTPPTRSTSYDRFRYLVESAGTLFLVIRYTRRYMGVQKQNEYETRRVLIFKFVDGKRKRWVSTKLLDINAMFFLGRLSSVSIADTEGESSGGRASSCVYFINDACDENFKDNCVFNLDAPKKPKHSFPSNLIAENRLWHLDWFKP